MYTYTVCTNLVHRVALIWCIIDSPYHCPGHDSFYLLARFLHSKFYTRLNCRVICGFLETRGRGLRKHGGLGQPQLSRADEDDAIGQIPLGEDPIDAGDAAPEASIVLLLNPALAMIVSTWNS